jgi:polyhydroxybutyrate depolymerase
MRHASLVAIVTLLAACGGEDDATTTAATTATTGPGAGGGGGTGGGGNGGEGGGGAPPSCRMSELAPGEQTFTIEFGGNMREYDVQVPLSYDGTVGVPLVLDFHGYTSDKDQQQSISGMQQLSESAGFVVVWPNGFGTLRSWNAGDFCCGQAQSQGLDDVGLARAIVADVSAKACIDPRRVYATGLSNGGAFSHRLACEAADLFAATAPVAYPIDFTPFDQCQPSRPIPVLHQHGRGDMVVPYDGSGFQPSTPASFAYWAQVNGCSGDAVVTYMQDDSICETYESCEAGVQVGLCSLDGGHVLYLENNDGVPVGELAWQFLSGFTLP